VAVRGGMASDNSASTGGRRGARGVGGTSARFCSFRFSMPRSVASESQLPVEAACGAGRGAAGGRRGTGGATRGGGGGVGSSAGLAPSDSARESQGSWPALSGMGAFHHFVEVATVRGHESERIHHHPRARGAWRCSPPGGGPARPPWAWMPRRP
jgi:hypothetical protein